MPTPDRDAVLEIIRRLKSGSPSSAPALPAAVECPRVSLQPVTRLDADDERSIGLLAEWRKKANSFFPAQFPVTHEGTRRWLTRQLLDAPERLLFWVVAPGRARIGHLGLFRFDFDGRSVELDNVVRGVDETAPGAMFSAVKALLSWSFENLGMRAIFLRVLSDNARAIRLYQRCGFTETMRMPLVRVEEGDVVRWDEAGGGCRLPVERYFVTMRLLSASPALPDGPHFTRTTTATRLKR